MMRWILYIFYFLTPLSVALASPVNKNPLLGSGTLAPATWGKGQSGDMRLNLNLPEFYKVYADTIKVEIVEPEGFLVGPLKVEPLEKWYDKTLKTEKIGFKKTATLVTHIEAPSTWTSKPEQMLVRLTYQACTDEFCLFPTQLSLKIPMSYQEDTVEMKPRIAEMKRDLFSLEGFRQFLEMGLGYSILFVFIAGIFTSFTPCIFPMIPITLAILNRDSNKHNRRENFIVSLIYVLGIASIYTLLGVAAALSGSVFGASLGNPWVLGFVCLIFLLMALSMYGLFDIQVPEFLRSRYGRGHHDSGYKGAYLSGVFAGIVASPCVGPVLVGILTYVSSTRNVVTGALLLFFYALGLGSLFIVLGLSNQLTQKLPKSGPWLRFSKFVLGSLMLSGFYYYLNLLIPRDWFLLSVGIGLMIVSSVEGAFISLSSYHGRMLHWMQLRKVLMIGLMALGIAFTVDFIFKVQKGQIFARSNAELNLEQKLSSQLPWLKYSEKILHDSLRSQKPVIFDFYADWCVACHELAKKTFANKTVSDRLGDFILIQFDATNDSEELKSLKQKFKIVGLPTVLFFDKKGQWLEHHTLTEFEDADQFLIRLKKIDGEK